ncbi:hypothetical protein BDZ97DRAFT_984748 [Flammula alnicola]|nr:hypothetical protein BDZ97DRAFT_984748 [Flammula alnicola]
MDFFGSRGMPARGACDDDDRNLAAHRGSMQSSVVGRHRMSPCTSTWRMHELPLAMVATLDQPQIPATLRSMPFDSCWSDNSARPEWLGRRRQTLIEEVCEGESYRRACRNRSAVSTESYERFCRQSSSQTLAPQHPGCAGPPGEERLAPPTVNGLLLCISYIYSNPHI